MAPVPNPGLAGEERRTLLHEVDHRVKNNLQLICSLIGLQSRRSEDEAARAALQGALERISAIGIVHHRLFQGDNPGRFDVAEFIRDLAADRIAGEGRDDIEVRLDLEPVAVAIAQAAPLALIVNELLTNAMRHAFPPPFGGLITIGAHRNDDGLEICVGDNGVGWGEAARPPAGFGLSVTEMLCRQLDAHFEVASVQPGVRAAVRLPTSRGTST